MATNINIYIYVYLYICIYVYLYICMYKEQQMKSGVRTLAGNRMYSRKLKYMSSYSGELRQKRTCRIESKPVTQQPGNGNSTGIRSVSTVHTCGGVAYSEHALVE